MSALRRLLLSIVAVLTITLPLSAAAANPVAHAVLFYSPTCAHCHVVMTETLPPLTARYGEQLAIAAVNISTPGGQELYQAMVRRFQVPEARLGVPALVIGETVLVGSLEIPQQLPGLIEQALARGGIPWPDIPGLSDRLPTATTLRADVATPSWSAPDTATPPVFRDMPANALAILVLLGMVGVTAWALRESRRRRPDAAPIWRDRMVPILALIGLAIAAYLTLVETSRATVVCGPLGDCATVQQSRYAAILGIPIGALGLVGYTAILGAWALEHLVNGRRAKHAGLALAGLAAGGTLFSIYLTFLEPFVIGATCMWCLTSALLMTALFAITAPYHGLLTRPVRRSQHLRSRNPQSVNRHS